MNNPNPKRLVLYLTLHNYDRTRTLQETHPAKKALDWLKKDESALMKYNRPGETRVTEIIDAFQNYMAEEYELDWTIPLENQTLDNTRTHRYAYTRLVSAISDLSTLISQSA